MNGILVPAIIEGINTRKDKTVKITIGTQEMPAGKAGELFAINGQLATVYFSIKGISQDEISAIDSVEPDPVGKTPSQRLRSVLYLMWKQNNEGYEDKNLHYAHHMEKIIEHFKNKLQP